MDCIVLSLNIFNDGKYKKKLLWIDSYISKRVVLTQKWIFYIWVLIIWALHRNKIKKNEVKWNILLTSGKQIKRDSASSENERRKA